MDRRQSASPPDPSQPLRRKIGVNEQEFTEHRIEEEKRLSQIDLKLSDLEKNIKDIKDDVADLVSAWKAASFILIIVKGLGAIATATAAILLLFKWGK